MALKDLREWIAKAEEIGELRTIKEAHWDLEIGALTRMAAEKGPSPALLFDEIKEYPPGRRVLANPLSSIKRQALTLNMPVDDYQPMQLVKACKEMLREVKPIPSRLVKSGPILENVVSGEGINIFEFPAPKWHEGDGGRYLGTGDLVITRDPDEGWVNLGTYRVMIHDEKTLGLYISPGRHGWMHREKCFSRGQPCRLAVSFGHDPLLFLLSSVEIPYGMSEYDMAGGIKGEPVEVVQGEYTGLPIPANAEIVVEGESLPGECRQEGPFGEWTGYYGSGVRPEPVIRIKSVMYRNNPVILGRAGGTKYLKAALVWDELEKAGVPDVRGVWYLEGGSSSQLLVVSIKQRYGGHARQAAMVATGCHAGAYAGRYIMVVDEDIDPSSTREVLWALATRSDPASSIEIFRRCWSSALDPIIPKTKAGFNSRAIIDACKPYEWMDDFPVPIKISEELRAQVFKKWGRTL